MDSFNQAALSYDRFCVVQRRMAEWLAEWLPDERGGDALEIAAGTGLFTAMCLPWHGNFTATDLAPNMVARGRARVPAVHWQRAAAESLPTACCDWLLSSSFLQWAPDPGALLRKWHQGLRPGGRLLCGFYGQPTLPELAAVLPEVSPLSWRSPEEWRGYFIQAGFRKLELEWTPRVFSFPTALDLLRTLHAIGAAPARRVALPRLRASVREYDRKFMTPDGVRSTWTFLRVRASQ